MSAGIQDRSARLRLSALLSDNFPDFADQFFDSFERVAAKQEEIAINYLTSATGHPNAAVWHSQCELGLWVGECDGRLPMRPGTGFYGEENRSLPPPPEPDH